MCCGDSSNSWETIYVFALGEHAEPVMAIKGYDQTGELQEVFGM
jgi:hypothetical protein